MLIPCHAGIFCRCTLEPKFIELGLLPFGCPKASSVRLDNIGTTPARFYFVAPPKLRESQDGLMTWDDNQPLCPPWLLIGQPEGEVQEGAHMGQDAGMPLLDAIHSRRLPIGLACFVCCCTGLTSQA